MGSFVRVEGLVERVKDAERKDKMFLYRFKRRLNMPRAKADRLYDRYYGQWLMYRIDHPVPNKKNPYDAFRREQIATRIWNRQGEIR